MIFQKEKKIERKVVLSWKEAQKWECFQEDVKFFLQGTGFQTLVCGGSVGDPVKNKLSRLHS